MKNERKAWQFPWGYSESLYIAAALFATGVLIQISSSSFAPLPSFPANIISLFCYLSVLITVRIFFKRSGIVQWLSSVPAAIGSVCFLGVLSVIMGLVPQSPYTAANDIFHNITNSWVYFLSLIYLLTVLGFTVLKRLLPFKGRNIWFQFNHLGLWIVLAGTSFGAGDMMRLKMEARLNTPVWMATDEYGRPVEPGIAVELKSFSIDYFAPVLSLYDFKEKKQIKKAKPVMVDSAGVEMEFSKWNIQVKEYLPSAVWVEGKFSPFHGPGAVPAVYINAKNETSEISGWVNPGNNLNPIQNLMLDDNTGLVLQHPQPKKYRSEIKVYSKTDSIYNTTVEVNDPAYIEGWRIYQISYDEKMGAWSDTSILELNRDPWLPVVYAGLLMMIIGALYLFVVGFRKKGDAG